VTSGPLRLGLVGAGAIAQTYAQALASCGSARLAAVADVRDEAARAMAESAGARAFASHQAMLAAGGLDAAVVCTPPSTHAEIALDLVHAGLHVLCEKPFTLSSAEARGMVDAAERAGVRLTMASKFRYVEDVIRAKSIVTSGILGEIVLFENAFTTRVDMAGRWHADPVQSGGGVLIDNGTHAFDLMRYFLGPLAEVQCVEGKRVQGLPVEDTVRIFARSTAGVMGSIDLSWSIDKNLDSYLNIYGSHGTVSVGWHASRYKQSSGRDWVVFGGGYDKLQAFRRQLENFAAAVRGREPLLVGPADAIASVEVVEAAYASLRENHWRQVAAGALTEIAS
jgi:predicted dehydrogenase